MFEPISQFTLPLPKMNCEIGMVTIPFLSNSLFLLSIILAWLENRSRTLFETLHRREIDFRPILVRNACIINLT